MNILHSICRYVWDALLWPSPVLLGGLMTWRLMAAPADIIDYARGTFIIPWILVLLFLVMADVSRREVMLAIQAAAFSLLLLAMTNELFIWLGDLLNVRFSNDIGAIFLLLELLASFHIAGNTHLGRTMTNPPVFVFLHAGVATSWLALLLKLESYPDALPYGQEAWTMTVLSPASYVLMASAILLLRSPFGNRVGR